MQCWHLRREVFSHRSRFMPVTVDETVERLGAAAAPARLTGVGTEAVRKWRQAHAIPSRHWPAVIIATGLSLADLSGTPGTAATAREPVEEPAGPPLGATAALVLADGSVFWGRGFGAHTTAEPVVGEVCFNTG